MAKIYNDAGNVTLACESQYSADGTIETCSDQIKLGDFNIKYVVEQDSSCVSIFDGNSSFNACYWNTNNTFTQYNDISNGLAVDFEMFELGKKDDDKHKGGLKDLSHEEYEALMSIATQYEILYHLTAGFDELQDKDYESYMTYLTEFAYF